MSGDHLAGEETELVTSDDEVESFCDSEINCSSDISETTCNKTERNNSFSKLSSKSDRNCPFSIDSILGRSNELHKHQSDISSNNTETESIQKSQTNNLSSTDICKCDLIM